MNPIEVIRKKLAENDCFDLAVLDALQKIERSLALKEEIERTLYESELYLVYKHTDPYGKVYIGITKNLPNSRWNDGAGYEKQTRFYKAIQKYGWIHFKHEIIAAGLNESEARQLENAIILELRAYDENYGYNTQVSKPDTETGEDIAAKSFQKKKAQGSIQEPNIEFNHNETATAIVEKFGIKTFNGKMYSLQDGNHIQESELLIDVKKELLVRYNLPPAKHLGMIERIKILSSTKEHPYASQNQTDVKRNPDSLGLVSFCQNFNFKILGGAIKNDELYAQYKDWSTRNNIHPLPKKSFARRIPDVMKKVRPDVVKYRTSSSRGWKILESHDD